MISILNILEFITIDLQGYFSCPTNILYDNYIHSWIFLFLHSTSNKYWNDFRSVLIMNSTLSKQKWILHYHVSLLFDCRLFRLRQKIDWNFISYSSHWTMLLEQYCEKHDFIQVLLTSVYRFVSLVNFGYTKQNTHTHTQLSIVHLRY